MGMVAAQRKDTPLLKEYRGFGSSIYAETELLAVLAEGVLSKHSGFTPKPCNLMAVRVQKGLLRSFSKPIAASSHPYREFRQWIGQKSEVLASGIMAFSLPKSVCEW